MSGRLGILGAFNRPRTLNPLHQSNSNCVGGSQDAANVSNSARYSKLERELNNLKEENAKLRSELNDSQTALKQLIRENSHEKFDERRINQLKFQLIQLERQIAILNEALGCRQDAVLEVENAMTWLADKLRSYTAADTKGQMILIARGDLTSMIELLESARIKLFKALEGTGKNTVGKDLIFMNPFLGGKYKQNEPLSLLDISLQRMDYINLRHVAQLESKLCQLYKELIRVHEHIQNVKPKSLSVGHMNSAEKDRSETMLLKACVMLKDVSDDLMALSLLCPSSPWPVLKRPLNKQVSIDRVIAALPALPRSKQEEVTHIIEASLQTCNHRHLLLTKQITMLKEELAFHTSVYDLEMQYMQVLFDAVRKGYGEFETSARLLICKPLKDILDAYKHLENSASEDAFREFLLIVKSNEEQLISVVETLDSQNFDSDETGAMAFSKFGEEFMGKINSLVRKCQNERDTALREHKTVKEEQKKKDLELQNLIEDLENKYDKIWIPKESVAPPSSVALLDKNDVGNHKEINHKFQRGNLNRESSSHLLEDGNEFHDKDTSSKIKHHNDGLTALKSSLNEDDGVLDKFKFENCTLKDKTDSSKEFNDCSLSVPDAGKYSIHDNNKDSKVRWKPDKEWIHDLSELPDTTEELLTSAAADLSEGNSCLKTVSQKKEYSKSNLQAATSKIFEKPKVQPRKSEYNIKKPLSYEPKLFLANRTLKLKHSGSFSKIDHTENADESSLSTKDKSDLELNKFTILNQPSYPGHHLSNNEGNITESARNDKQKFWR